MLNILSCPDIHVRGSWLDVSRQIMGSIENASKDVDLVAYPGDLWDKVPLGSDAGGLPEVIRHIESVHCPKVAVYGTESHDAKGSYRALEKAGLTILHPRKVYGLYPGYVAEIGLDHAEDPDLKAVLFGVPEPRKSAYMAKQGGNKTAEEINADLAAGVHSLITDFIAPARMHYANYPAFGMLHGNVSDAMDSGSETDIIMKASDVITKTDVMKIANLDAWLLGHIHTPWQSRKICAFYSGFAGIDKNPWGKRGFVPAMTRVSYSGEGVTLSRIPYGTPQRVKIFEPAGLYDPHVAYWLVTSDPSITKVEGGHEWSRVTRPEEKRVAERRVSAEALEEVETLLDVAELYQPEMKDSIKDKIKEIRQKIPEPVIEEKNLVFTKIRVQGCKFYHGRTLEVDFEQLPNRQICITGDNGEGKSSLFSWAHWWPVCIGKDTESGRQSAIKDFFGQKDSQIYKEGYKNGVKHVHIIDIKAAHTKQPKVICSLIVDGKQILDAADWETMMATCTKLYGSLDDYIMTAMYVQPQQSDKYKSGLMNANMTEMRDLVQNITGIDYEQERKYAYGRAAEIREQIERRDMEIDALISVLPNIEEMREEIIQIDKQIEEDTASLTGLQLAVADAEAALKIKADLMAVQAAKIEEREEVGQKVGKLEGDIRSYTYESSSKLGSSAFVIKNTTERLSADEKIKSEYESALKEYEAVQEENESIREDLASLEAQKRDIEDKLREAKSAHEESERQKIQAVKDQNEKIREERREIEQRRDAARAEQDNLIADARRDYDQAVKEYEYAKEFNQQIRKQIEALRVHCEKCGHIQSDAQEKIDELTLLLKDVGSEPVYTDPIIPENILKACALATDHLVEQPIPQHIPFAPPADLYASYTEIKQKIDNHAKPSTIILPDRGLSAEELAELRSKLSEAEKDAARAESIRTEILPPLEEQLAELRTRLESIIIEEVTDNEERSALNKARQNVKNTEEQITAARTTISKIEERISDTEAKIYSAEAERRTFTDQRHEADEWEEVYKMLMPAKLPAFQLEGYLNMIDDVATDTLTPWREGRHYFETETQIQGKKGTVDKFACYVCDSETGDKKLFTQHSPGEKGMLNDALVKALRKVRLMRQKTDYTPVVLDEADAPINEDNLPAYMEMQQNFYGDNRQILTVTHKAAYQELIGNKYWIGGFVQ